MPDTNDQTLSNPQALVDAALTAPVAAMGDETPLAFVAPAAPVTETPVAPPVPEQQSSYLPPTPPVPPAPEKMDVGKPKTKMGIILGGIFLLVVALGGGVWRYSYFTTLPQVAGISQPLCIAEGGKWVNGKCDFSAIEEGGGSELNYDNDANNCGSRGNKCFTENGTATCKKGDCVYTCAAGYEKQSNETCKLINKGGPVSCGSINAGNCENLEIGGDLVSEKGTGDYCNKNGEWCSVYRNECKIGTQHCLINTDENCREDARCTKTPPPSAPPSVPPSVPPSAAPVTPTMACTGLTQTPPSTPTIGDKLTFTCSGKLTAKIAGTVAYNFRYAINNGAWTNLANKSATTSTLTISACGTYKVECRVCATIAGLVQCDPFWQYAGVQPL